MVKKIEIADILLWNDYVGSIAWDETRNISVLEFDQNFIKKGLDIAPIMMPLKNQLNGELKYSFNNLSKNTFFGLPGMLSDLLPDRFGNAIIDRWLTDQGRTPESFTPIERLCYTGTRGMGALEFRPSNNSFKKSVNLEIDSLVGLANEVINKQSVLKTNFSKNTSKENALLDIIRVGTSAGGARPKAVIAINDNTKEIRSGQVLAPKDFDYWLLKFDGVNDKSLDNTEGFGRIEYVYYKMAIDSGINMSECRLFEENNRAHFMTKRFDRVKGEKVHMQTLCGIAHFDFNILSGYSYEQAFQIMRQLRLPYKDAKQLYLRMIFNVIARNQDDHTKNISFLMDKTGKWSLSPAYDITYAFNPNGIWTSKHQMSINGKHDKIEKEDLLIIGKKMNIKQPNRLIEKVLNAVAKWTDYAKELGVLSSQIKSIKKVHKFL